MKTSITLSKSGHYTVTIHGECKYFPIFKESKIGSKADAQRIAKEAKACKLWKQENGPRVIAVDTNRPESYRETL